MMPIRRRRFWPSVDRYTKDTTAYVALTYNPLDNDLINTTAKLTYSDEEIDLFSLDTSSDIYNADHRTKRVALTVENEAIFTTGTIDHTLTTGVEIGKRERSSVSDTGSNSVSAPGGTDEYVALYATDKMIIGDLTLTPQLRYESQTLTAEDNGSIANGTEYEKDALVGALSARYALTDQFAVFGTIAYNENLPILDDLSNATYIEQSGKRPNHRTWRVLQRHGRDDPKTMRSKPN